MSLEETLKNLTITEKKPARSCGCHNHEDVPELIVAPIPHRIRHGAIHGALNVLTPGEALILNAPHEPLPLLHEVKAREENFEFTYLDQGPEAWRILIRRT